MALVRRLVKEGHEVCSFSRKKYPEHEQLGVHSMCGDVADLEDCMEACEGVDVVFHIAGKVGVWGSYAEFFAANVGGTQHIIQACLEQGVGTFIFTSSASVVFGGSSLEGVDESHDYPQKPVSHYTSTKAEAERLVLNANCNSLRTISLRPHIVWGPGDTQITPKILKRAQAGRLRKPGKKDYLTDITYIDNFIDAQLLAMKKLGETGEVSGRAFFITNGEPVLAWDFINAIVVSEGLPQVSKTFPKSAALLAAWCLEAFYKITGVKKEPFITRFLVQELCTHHWFDISAARDLLEYTPRIHFKEGLKRIS